MDFLIKFASEHESFRVPEIEALAILEGLDLKVKEYDREVSAASFSRPFIRTCSHSFTVSILRRSTPVSRRRKEAPPALSSHPLNTRAMGNCQNSRRPP